MEALPDNWMKLTPPQLDNLAQSLSPDSEYIDWRTFLLQTAQPWPQPSQAQLLETLQRFYDADVLNAGMITRDQFEQVSVFVSPELSSERDYVITHSVCSMYVCMCMYVVICKIDHCIHIHWCIPMGLGHNDPWVESHMWPQQMWGQRSSRGQWPLV